MAKIRRDSVDQFFDYDVSLDTRTIYIGSNGDDEGEETGVDYKMAEKAIKALHLLSQSEGPITILMNNLGGDFIHGMAIYDAIKEKRNHITVKAYCYCMSMGTLILQAADERVLAAHSQFMIHYGYAAVTQDDPVKFESWNKRIKKDNELMEKIYLEKIRQVHPEFPVKQLRKMLRDETILDPEDVIALGLADKLEE
jgi:ATP-dependent Clp protease protease subunit